MSSLNQTSMNQPHADRPCLTPELDREWEHRLDEALGSAPSVVIPEGFAARVASLVPDGTLMPTPRRAWSRSIMFASVVALLLAILALAPHAVAGANFAITLEWILCVQLSLLALSVALPGSLLRLA